METQDHTKEYRNATAESLVILSMAIFTVSLVDNTRWATIALIIFGAIFALSGVYLIIPCNLKQQWFLGKLATQETMAILKRLGWLLILVLFGYALTQKGTIWLIVVGLLFMISAYVVFYISIGRVKMGTRARKSVNKPDQDKGNDARKQ